VITPNQNAPLISGFFYTYGRILDSFGLRGGVSAIGSFVLPFNVSICVLVFLITSDTVFGIINAIRDGCFSSKRMRETLVKFLMYTLVIICVRLVEILISPNIRFITDSVFIYLSLVEFKSILENAGRLGLPLPDTLFKFLIKKAPYAEVITGELSTDNKYILEQDNLVKDFYITLTDNITKRILQIEFAVWREFCIAIYNSIDGDVVLIGGSESPFTSKIRTEFRIALRLIKNRWKDCKIPKDKLEGYLYKHSDRLAEFEKNILEVSTCYKSLEDKIDVIMAITTQFLRMSVSDYL
jgi:toxin secretion/phage lysis holin